MPTPKENYEALVQKIMETVFTIPDIESGTLLSVANDCKELWKFRTDLLELRTQVQSNDYYRNYIQEKRVAKMKTFQEKSQNDKWCNCPKCDRRVKRSNLEKHKKTDVCKDIRLSKGLTLTHKRIPHKDYPIYHIVNHTINRMINGELPKYIELEEPMKFQRQRWIKSFGHLVLVKSKTI